LIKGLIHGGAAGPWRGSGKGRREGGGGASGGEANAKIFDELFDNDFIGRRVKKLYNSRAYKNIFHGVIKWFEVKPNNVNRIVFRVFFENGKWDKIHDGELEKCLLP
jgi:hypothetical protein